MIQDIAPHKLHIEFYNLSPQKEDCVLAFSGGEILLCPGEKIVFPRRDEFSDEAGARMMYLFSVDDMRCFYLQVEKEEAGKLLEAGKVVIAGKQEFRRRSPKHLAFAAVTGFMLDGWYRSNRYCGRCGQELEHDEKERMLKCPACGQQVYPRINPAVIVAVTSGEKLLLTKYRGREYGGYALVAGFTEIGETFEDTVRREVMEETGLKVKNIRYFGSQPWAFADNILAGYICEADGDEEIRMDEDELAVACWISREQIPVEYTDTSLTNEMICAFKSRKY